MQVPVIIPYIVLLVSAYLVVGPVINKPQWEYLYATAFILTGLLVYVPFVKWSYSLPFMGKSTSFTKPLRFIRMKVNVRGIVV